MTLALSVGGAGCAALDRALPRRLKSPSKQLDAVSAVKLERAYRRLDPSDPQRKDIRASLVRYLVAEAERVHAADEYDAAVEKLARIASLLLSR